MLRPNRRRWKPNRQLNKCYRYKIRSKSRPNKQTSFTIAPHFGHTIIDDIRYGKYDKPSCHGQRADRNDFYFQNIRYRKAYAEQYAHQGKCQIHGLLHHSCFLRGYPRIHGRYSRRLISATKVGFSPLSRKIESKERHISSRPLQQEHYINCNICF